MKLAPLQLIDYWATSIRVEAIGGFDAAKHRFLNYDKIKIENSIKLLSSDEGADSVQDGTQWLVDLSVSQESADECFPYLFEVTMQGVVMSHPGLKGEGLRRAISVNGPAMLFGAAREIIRAATGRGPYPAVVIPSTNFLDDVDVSNSSEDKIPPKKKQVRKKAVAKKSKKGG